MSASCKKNHPHFSSFAVRIGVLALVLSAAIAAGIAAAPAVSAAGVCPDGADSCLIVNTNADVNLRDTKLSLREAMLLDTGGLSYSSLTTLERAQTLLNTQNAMAPDGIRYIYFDPTVFCEGCPTSVIVLSPPGFGGPSARKEGTDLDVVGDAGINDEPPGFGGPSSLPPGFGGPSGSGGGLADEKDGFGLIAKAAEMMTPPGFGGPSARLGMSAGSGGEFGASVVLDGTLLDAGTSGIAVDRRAGWIRGLHFQNFSGAAIELHEAVSSETVIGSDFDQSGDADESVTFSSNGVDIRVVGE